MRAVPSRFVLEAARVIDDQWAWMSLSRLAPNAYHDPAWTGQSLTRVRRAVRGMVRGYYVRVWDGGALIGCPLIRTVDRLFNTPRSTPLVLNGEEHPDPSAALVAALRKVSVDLIDPRKLHLHDDTSTLDAIAFEAAAIEADADDVRRTRSWTPGDTARVFSGYRWPDRSTREDWDESLSAVFRSSSWQAVMRIHTCSGAPVGWTIWAERPAGSTCIAAVHHARPLHAWSSPR